MLCGWRAALRSVEQVLRVAEPPDEALGGGRGDARGPADVLGPSPRRSPDPPEDALDNHLPPPRVGGDDAPAGPSRLGRRKT